MLGQEEIRGMSTALGTGISKEDFDASKLRYGKVILMTDSDVDGSHIRTWLLTLFFRHMQELVKRGNVFIAQPRLYSIKKGKKERSLKSVESRFDEEHNLWEVSFVNSQGAEHMLNWELASTPEYRQLLSKFKQIEANMEPPFVVETVAKAAPTNGNAEELSDAEREDMEKAQKKTTAAPKRKAAEPQTVEKGTPRDLFDYVLAEGRKDYT